MLPWSYCGTEQTEAEIEAFRQKLRTQAQTWINETEQRLLDQITTWATRITASIDSWKVRAIEYINKVNEQFKCCVNNKNAKIATTGNKNANKPAANVNSVVIKKNSRATYKSIRNTVRANNFRKDQKRAAVKKASAILKSQAKK